MAFIPFIMRIEILLTVQAETPTAGRPCGQLTGEKLPFLIYIKLGISYGTALPLEEATTHVLSKVHAKNKIS
jgi:hypothetical protein